MTLSDLDRSFQFLGQCQKCSNALMIDSVCSVCRDSSGETASHLEVSRVRRQGED